ncbi:DoxX family protein [Streptomyces jietaisiensis]|uniref:DoxX family protein n=1 Tax=Streptomyces griseoaurantiacus TaxID=68213 RepID=UPI002E29C588|nr:DoxX family protein [Streptomyces jietaisiensis]
MSVLRVLGRPMLASMFIAGGLDSVRHPERVAEIAEPVVRPVSDRVPMLPDSTLQAVRINGAVQVAAGVLLGLGRMPRLSALALAGTLVPTTLAGHRFWEAEEGADRVQQRIHFLKNVSMFGGLLVTADDTHGVPSLLWRGRHTAKELRREARLVRRSARMGALPGAAVGGVRAGAKGVKGLKAKLPG